MKDNSKKDEYVKIHLPWELRNYKKFGFNNISEFIQAAVANYNSMENSQIELSVKILDQLANQIDSIEKIRDNLTNYNLPTPLKDHMNSLYIASDEIASSKLMLESPINYTEDIQGRKQYKYAWALLETPDYPKGK